MVVLWFTGQAGVLGRLDPQVGRVEVFDAPRGPGPYGSTVTPDGQVFYASLAGSYIGRIDHRTGAAEVLEPPTGDQGARRVWSDSRGRIWVSEWNAGQLGRYDPAGRPLAGVEAARRGVGCRVRGGQARRRPHGLDGQEGSEAGW